MLGCPPINPCLYNGKCVERPFGFTCQCEKPYFGNRCQFKRKRRTSTAKTSTNTRHIIFSTSSSSGDESSTGYNHLIARPSCNGMFICQNKGVCLDTFNGFKCQCLPQYTGLYCEFYIDYSPSYRIIQSSNSTIFTSTSSNSSVQYSSIQSSSSNSSAYS